LHHWTITVTSTPKKTTAMIHLNVTIFPETVELIIDNDVFVQPNAALTYRRRQRWRSARTIIEFAQHGERKARAAVRWSRFVGGIVI
jgi:hypothetical protein